MKVKIGQKWIRKIGYLKAELKVCDINKYEFENLSDIVIIRFKIIKSDFASHEGKEFLTESLSNLKSPRYKRIIEKNSIKRLDKRGN